MIRRRRPSNRTPLDAARELYATGRMSLGDFEATVEATLRVAEASIAPRRRPDAREAAERWAELTAAKAANWTTGIEAGRW